VPVRRADQGLYDLYAAYLHRKADDLVLVDHVIGRAEIGNALDLCGGYGRAASLLQVEGQRWLVVDQAPEMIRAGARFFSGKPIKPEFMLGNLENHDLSIPEDFATALMLYNSINEIRNIEPALMLASRALHLGGRLMIKCIVHDESYDPSGPNTSTVDPFFTIFDEKTWGEVTTTMTGRPGGEQMIELRFRSRQGTLLGEMCWTRWIHDFRMIDAVCSAHGLILEDTLVGNEYRLYSKRR
jgi:ubiquinone/menaquinone biosynthesis C-methylase UbiE